MPLGLRRGSRVKGLQWPGVGLFARSHRQVLIRREAKQATPLYHLQGSGIPRVSIGVTEYPGNTL